jgi:hypothetical protein
MLQRKREATLPSTESLKNEIPLIETIQSLRTQLSQAVKAVSDQDTQFPVDGVELEFHVGVTRSAVAGGGLRFWVVELGAGASYATESIHTVTVSLGAPVDATGQAIKIRRDMPERP